MAVDAHKNFAYSTVATAPVSPTAGTSLTVAAGDGAKFPAVPFNATVWAASAIPTTANAEIVRVTAIAGDVLTITRTTPTETVNQNRGILVGDQISAPITDKMLNDLAAGPIFSAGTSSGNLSSIVFGDSNNVSFGLSGSTVTALAGPWLSYMLAGTHFSTPVAGNASGSSQVVQPVVAPPAYYSLSYLRILGTQGVASTTYATSAAQTGYSASGLTTLWAVFYSMGTGANSRSLQYVASGSASFAYQLSVTETGSQYTISHKITYPTEGGTSSFSTSTNHSSTRFDVVTAGILTNFTSFRVLDIPFANSLSPGNYWVALGMSTTTSTQGTAALIGCNISLSSVGQLQVNTGIGYFGAASQGSLGAQIGIGVYTTNSIQTQASIALSQLGTLVSNIYFPFQGIRQV